MNERCRYTLLIEYAADDELIEAIVQIEKQLPDYDYASRPYPMASGTGHFKFLAFKDLRGIPDFPKFARKALSLQNRLRGVRLTPGYVSLVGAITAGYSHSPGSVFMEKELWLKAQLVLSGKLLVSHSLTDEILKDKRSVIYLNDVWQLVKGAMK
ncbi:MAG: hypothetical protein ACOY5B_06175 [Spirochaetota bacterium]